MTNFIRKKAIKNYKKEARRLIDILSEFEKERLADYFIMSVWTRAGMQIEGHIKGPSGEKYISPKLSAYPILIPQFRKIVKAFSKRQLKTEATAMSIWLHSLRALLYYSELKQELNELWKLLMSTKNLWEKYLERFYNEDKQRLSSEMLNDTYDLSKKILENLPPSPGSDKN